MTTDEKLAGMVRTLSEAMKENLPKDVGFVLVLKRRNEDGRHELGCNLSPPAAMRTLRDAQVQIARDRSRVVTVGEN